MCRRCAHSSAGGLRAKTIFPPDYFAARAVVIASPEIRPLAADRGWLSRLGENVTECWAGDAAAVEDDPDSAQEVLLLELRDDNAATRRPPRNSISRRAIDRF